MSGRNVGHYIFISIMKKELCSCGKMATWLYMPGYAKGESPFHCDDCVPRGCSCHNRPVSKFSYGHSPLEKDDLPEGKENVDWKWIEKDVQWTHIDTQGREFPCCEYEYEEEGFDSPLPCPMCEDGKAYLECETRIIDYKGQPHSVEAYFYQCFQCKKEFTTMESDTKTLSQIPGYMENTNDN